MSDIKCPVLKKEYDKCVNGCSYLMSLFSSINEDMEKEHEEVRSVKCFIRKQIRNMLEKSVLYEDTDNFINKSNRNI